MEGLIVIILIGIISSFLGKMGDREQKPMPPFGGGKPVKTIQPKERSGKPRVFTLEDFAKEIFQQFENTSEQKPEPVQAKEKSENVSVEQKDEPIPAYLNMENPSLQTNERSLERKPIIQPDQSEKKELPDFVPNTKEALVQAIITSEILGPPLAKRR